MISHLRLILPRSGVVIFAVLFLCLEGPVLCYEWEFGKRMPGLRIRPGTTLLYLASAFYGIHRAVAFHPFYQEDYRKWLELTPWTVDKPLPLGPIALIWEDGIVLGVLILLTLTQPTHNSVRLLNTFLFWHSIFLMATFWPTGVGRFGYLVALGLGLGLRLWPIPWACFAVNASVWLVAHEGLWQSLARFPWPIEWSARDLNDTGALMDRLAGPSCGWPYDRFHRDVIKADRFQIGRPDAILSSMLLGWWVFGLESLVPDLRDRGVLSAFACAGTWGTCFIGRAVSYLTGYAGPLSLWGRLFTLNWIIPRYDKVFLGLIVAALMPIAVGLCLPLSVPLDVRLAITITLIALITLTTPPGLKAWRLTGQHRMVPAIPQTQASNYVKAG
jgi:hypothetical protein